MSVSVKPGAAQSIEGLVELRDSIGSMLSEAAVEFRRQLASVTRIDMGNGARRGLKLGRKRGSALQDRTVRAKYRSKKDPKLTWAGRGATGQPPGAIAFRSSSTRQSIASKSSLRNSHGPTSERRQVLECESNYLEKSLDRSTTSPLASAGPSKNFRDARSSITSRSRTN